MATLAERVSDTDELSILSAVAAHIDENVEDSSLIDRLADPDGDLTLFAPTNVAFAVFAIDLGLNDTDPDAATVLDFLTQEVDAAALGTILLHHMTPGTRDSGDIAAADTLTMLGGGLIGTTALPTLTDSEPDLIDPTLVAVDVAADNGLLHAIDRVLLPADLPGNDAPSIMASLADDSDFDLFSAAATATGLDNILADTEAGLTLFAPDDAAFVTLAQSAGYAGTDEADALAYFVAALDVLSRGAPLSELDGILSYHIALQPLQSAQLFGAGSITTLAGPVLTVENGLIVDANPGTADATLTDPDIQAANGVLHRIDQVLLPGILALDEARPVVGTASADNIAGGDARDFINGLAGDDVLRGQDGNDVLFAGDGADTVDGGAGADLIRGGASSADRSDTVYAGAGADSVAGGAGNDLLFGMAGDDILDGGFGADMVAGQMGDDTVTGGALGDTLFGNDGDDFINGGFGFDQVNGGAGADRFFHLGLAGHGSDWIQDFADGDVLVFGQTATSDDFGVQTAVTDGAGDAALAEAFVTYRPTGQILWALVDGAALDGITVQIAGGDTTFDLSI